MPTTPFYLPITVTKGITFETLEFNFRHEDLSPFNLTVGGTWKVLAYARRSKDAKQKIDLDPQITDGPNGQAKIAFTDEQAAAQMAGKYDWDMVLESPIGERLGPYFSGPYVVDEVNTHG